MIDKLVLLKPEIVMFIAACVVMIIGVSHNLSLRRLCAPITAIGLIVAGLLAYSGDPQSHSVLPNMAAYGKVIVSIVGLLLLMMAIGLPDRDYEAQVTRGATFNPLRGTRGEFYAFFLFSLTGVMLCAGADDLIWLFLALELTSLPTYIMVTMSTARSRSMEAGVKYFFLGALGAATFLYGFALLYGATGTTYLPKMTEILQAQLAGEGLSGLAAAGLILSVLGVCFKIAAVPMHYYTADVYQGAASPVSAFLAFVPKTAGFFALLLIVSTVGWSHADVSTTGLPQPLHAVLWIIAVLTMTVGNVLALLQTSVKRMLAYSSIAHSGYMLVGLIAGPGRPGAGFTQSGIAAIMFYLLAYGVMNIGAFAVLSALERQTKSASGATSTDEIDDIADVRGLCSSQPLLGWTLVISAVGLLGLPPLLGFFSKLPLFSAGIAAGEITLVVILGLNSAIAAYYYLRLASVALLEAPDAARAATIKPAPFQTRAWAGVLSSVGIVGLMFYPVGKVATWAGQYAPAREAGTPGKPPAKPATDVKLTVDAGTANPAANPAIVTTAAE